MQKFAAALLFASALSTPCLFAQSMDNMGTMDMTKTAPSPGHAVHKATGIIKKIDTTGDVVTIAHEPIKSLNWPAMTMGFAVKQKSLLDGISVGKKIAFELVQGDKGYVITAIK